MLSKRYGDDALGLSTKIYSLSPLSFFHPNFKYPYVDYLKIGSFFFNPLAKSSHQCPWRMNLFDLSAVLYYIKNTPIPNVPLVLKEEFV